MSLIVRIKKELSNFTLDVNFEVEKGVFSLFGASGSGKSMILKCIAGIETPDFGYIELNNKVFFDSKNHINLTPQNRNIGFLFQNYALFPNMTVEENIKCGIRKKESIDIDYIMKLFSIYDIRNKKPNNISGGEQQRTAIARIFVSYPDILMLDEPLSALDEYMKFEIEEFISNSIEKFNCLSLYVSHNRDDIFRLSDNIAIIDNGKIDNIDSKYNIFFNPKTYLTATLVGAKNFTRIKVLEDNKIKCLDWNIELDILDIKVENKNAKYISIMPYSFYCENFDKEKMLNFECKILKIIENIFYYNIMLTPLNAIENIKIVYQCDKSVFNRMNFYNNKNIFIYFRRDDILFLE